MSKYTAICNRCGDTAEQVIVDETTAMVGGSTHGRTIYMPKGWVFLDDVQPREGGPADEQRRRYGRQHRVHLCGTCATSFKHWLHQHHGHDDTPEDKAYSKGYDDGLRDGAEKP